jgi:decaprenylphospho-beta-D-ribofuranose 2-oxidase
MTWKNSTYKAWGRALSANGELARPESQKALAAIADQGPALGMRRSYGDASLRSEGRAIDMTRLDRFLDFDEASGEVTVEAGVRLGDILRVFAPKGWLPPVLPGTGFATVGGAIANDVHGKNHHLAGTFGEHVTAINLIQNGKAVTVSPTKSEAMFRATVAGLGQTGIITSAKLRLLPAKGDLMMVTERRVRNWDEQLDAITNAKSPYVVGWIDATASGAEFGRGIVEEGETGFGIVKRRGRSRAFPFDAPSFATSKAIVKMFNALYLRRVSLHGRTRAKPLSDFYFPLDRILDWNRGYGKAGFHQFQCVVPLASTDRLKAIMERIVTSGLAMPPTVIKRLGPGRGGMMSFPMEGWTLAVDFPNRGGSMALIEELHGMTEDAGGRIYLAKDSLLSPDRVRQMYPDLADWQKLVKKADPEGRLQTDLVKRLKLREVRA